MAEVTGMKMSRFPRKILFSVKLLIINVLNEIMSQKCLIFITVLCRAGYLAPLLFSSSMSMNFIEWLNECKVRMMVWECVKSVYTFRSKKARMLKYCSPDKSGRDSWGVGAGGDIDAPALLGIAEIEQVYGYGEVALAKQFGGIRIGAGSIVINAVTIAIAAKAKLDAEVLIEHLSGKYTDAAIGAAAGAVVGIVIAHRARTEAEANAKIPAMYLAIACRFLLIIAAGLIAIAGVAAAAAAGEGAGCCAIGIGEGGFGAVGIDYRYYACLHDGDGGAVLVVKVFIGDLGGVYL